MTGDFANQSADLTAVLDSVDAKATYALSASANGNTKVLDPSKILEYMGDERPNYEGDQHVVFRLREMTPEMYAGSGRLASQLKIGLQFVIWTKFGVDKAGVSKGWLRNQNRGHWRIWVRLLDAFQDRNLFPTIDGSGVESGDKLTVEPLQMMPDRFAQMLKREPGWGFSSLLFQLSLVKRVTI